MGRQEDRQAALKNLARMVQAETSGRVLNAIIELVEIDRQGFQESLVKADSWDRARFLQGQADYAKKLTDLNRDLQGALDRE